VNFTELFVNAEGECYIYLPANVSERPIGGATIWVICKAEDLGSKWTGETLARSIRKRPGSRASCTAPVIAITLLAK
jgi:hypothetical protein